MIAESVLVLLVALTGFVVLRIVAHRIPLAARAWLALPVGSSIYLFISLLCVVIARRLDVAIAIITLLAILGFGVLRVRFSLEEVRAAGMLLVGIIGVVALAHYMHATQVTPDSVRYILFSKLVQGDGIEAVHALDLMKRQLGLPALHAMAALVDTDYLKSLGPLFGIGLMGFLIWFTRELMPKRYALGVGVGLGAFLLSTNRFLYACFYLNTHIQMASYLTLGLCCLWLAYNHKESQWAIPAGLSLSATVLLRPEAPLFAALIVIAYAALLPPRRATIYVSTPLIIVAAAWYIGVILQHPYYLESVRQMAPPVGNLMAIMGAGVILLLSGWPRLHAAVSKADRVLLGFMAAVFAVLAAQDLEVLADSIRATILNVQQGGWALTWPLLLLVGLIAIFNHEIPGGRLWSTTLIGSGLLYLMLPALREGTYRPGAGDSGNRVLIHIVPVVVIFLFLAVSSRSDPSGTTSTPPLGGASRPTN